jgi:four helix bundle protein
MRRAASSIPANIAEGFERDTPREFIRFLRIAKGSAGELRTYLYLARALNYVDESAFHKLLDEVRHISSMIANLASYLASHENV